MSHTKPAYMNVLIVQEYETASGKGRNWTKVGVAFPHAERTRIQHRPGGLPARRQAGRPSAAERRQRRSDKREPSEVSTPEGGLIRKPFSLLEGPQGPSIFA